jgi:hypothetical protein
MDAQSFRQFLEIGDDEISKRFEDFFVTAQKILISASNSSRFLINQSNSEIREWIKTIVNALHYSLV